MAVVEADELRRRVLAARLTRTGINILFSRFFTTIGQQDEAWVDGRL